jgi:hypothetical protein
VLWIVLAWLLFAVSVVVGVVVFVTGVTSAASGVAPSPTFESGGAVSVQLEAGDKPAIWVSTNGQTNVKCQARSENGAGVQLSRAAGQQTLTIDGRKWELVFNIGVPAAGTYQVSCTADDPSGVRFGVGKDLLSSAGSIVSGVVVLVVVPLVGFLIALIVTIVVLVRRSRARKRMAAASGPGWSPYGPPPGGRG